MNYEDCVEKLKSKGMFRINPGLERISGILSYFDNPQDDLKYIHVAGTNGKGSVCAILESILREAGYKTGLYTSPHIFDYTERIKINGIDISKEDFANIFSEVLKKSTDLKIDLTEFEILTVVMFLYFQRNDVEIVVLETGMGGRFDATNVIKKNLCSIITRIDLDHTDRLGNTKEEIAFEKAGIIKHDCPVVTSMGFEAIKDKAEKEDSVLILTNDNVDAGYAEALALKGLHQKENLSLALSAIEYLFPQINNETIIKGLKKVKHPFRFEYFKDKNLIIDASHNPNGIRALRNNLDYYFPDKERRFVFGCLNTKDYKSMMNILFKSGDEIYLNEFDYPHACTYEQLKKACPFEAKQYSSDIKLTPDKLNIICGSFYMLENILDKALM